MEHDETFASVGSPNTTNQPKSRLPLLLLVLIGAIIFLCGGIAALFYLDKDPVLEFENTVEQKVEDDSVQDSINGKYLKDSADFRTKLLELSISDDLALELQKNPKYLQAEKVIINPPSYEGLDLPQVKSSFKTSITSRFDEIDESARKFMIAEYDFSSELGSFLSLLSYIARISKSPYLNVEEKISWKEAVDKGKILVSDMLYLMGDDYRLIVEEWLDDNIYTKEEFR